MAQGIPSKLKLEIVTPDEQLFKGEVDEVVVPGEDGCLGILPGHAPLISTLQSGVLTYKVQGQETHLFCGAGFVEVLPDSVAVLADRATVTGKIDVEQASQDKAEAEKLIRSNDPTTDYEAALLLLRDATARLEASSSRQELDPA